MGRVHTRHQDPAMAQTIADVANIYECSIEVTVGGFTSWTEQGRVQATAGRAAGTVAAPAGSASMHARVKVVQ